MLLFLLSFFALCENEERKFPPIYISDENSTLLKDYPLVFIMSNYKGSKFCDDVIQDFIDASEELQGKLQFAIIEANYSEKFRSQYHIYTYPSYYVFRYGNMTGEYGGERDKNSIVKYTTKISGPNTITLEDGRSLRDFIDQELTSCILASEDIDPELLQTFDEVAYEFKDLLSFATVTDPDAIDLMNLETTPALQLSRLQDRSIINLPLTNFTKESIREFIKKNYQPRYMKHDTTSFRKISADPRYTIIAFVDSTKKKNLDMMHQIMGQVADTYLDNFTYLYCDIFDYGNLVLSMGFQGIHDPCFAIIFMENFQVKEKHILPDKYDATQRRVLSFVNKFYNQSLSQKQKHGLMSEPVPEPEKNKGPFMKLVGSTFYNTVTDNKTDSVLLSFQREDQEQKELMDIFYTVAHEFQKQKVSTVKFYYLNMSANDTPGFKYPKTENSTIITFFPAEFPMKPLLMPTEVDAKTLCSYIVSNAKSKFKFRIPKRLSVSSYDIDL